MASDDSPGRALSQLSHSTPFMGLKVYLLIGIFLVIVLVIVLVISLCIRRNRISTKSKMRVKHSSGTVPLVTKEIVEVKALDLEQNCEQAEITIKDEDPRKEKVEIEIERRGKKSSDESDVSGGSRGDLSVEAPNLGWGRWYSLRELEDATRGFAEENVIGEGGYGIVYRGVLEDGSVVAVKNLLNNKYALTFSNFM